MIVLLPSLRRIEKQVTAYSEAAGSDEELLKAHEDAMACFDLEARISQGIHLFEMILALDTRWKKLVHSNQISEDAACATAIQALFRDWMNPAQFLEKRIQDFEGKRFDVEGADEFRKNCNHTQAILKGFPTTWRGHRIRRESDLAQCDFPFPPEPS